MSLQKKATIIASICAISLALVKFTIGIMSGSIAVLSSALDSLMDFIISAFNFLAVKKSAQKANEDYNFGFSKIEALMGFLEGSMIIGVAVFILYQSIEKIYNKEQINDLNLSIFVMIFSIVVTLFLVIFLSFVAKKTKSLIIESDCLHYKSDLLSNAFTLLALVIIYFTNFYIIDAIFGLLISAYISFSAFEIIKKSVQFLMDKALDDDKVNDIKNIIKSHPEVKSYHYLKTRKTPSINYISVHLVLCPVISLYDAHKIGDQIENAIKAKFENELCDIQIHLDPYDDSKNERL